MKKFNKFLNNEKARKLSSDLGRVAEFTGKAVLYGLCLYAASITCSRNEFSFKMEPNYTPNYSRNNIVHDDDFNPTYGDVVTALMTNNGLSSYDKKCMLNIILKDAGIEYYKAVIGIIQSNMTAYDKRCSIRSIS